MQLHSFSRVAGRNAVVLAKPDRLHGWLRDAGMSTGIVVDDGVMGLKYSEERALRCAISMEVDNAGDGSWDSTHACFNATQTCNPATAYNNKASAECRRAPNTMRTDATAHRTNPWCENTTIFFSGRAAIMLNNRLARSRTTTISSLRFDRALQRGRCQLEVSAGDWGLAEGQVNVN